MRRSFFCFAILVICTNLATANAMPNAFGRTPLNQVTFQLSNEAWVTTKTAKVIVQVNASLKSEALGKIHSDLLSKLARLSNAGEWHITDFNRSQDQSGLERLQVIAEARLPENALANLRDTAKDISKPGETYTIQDIQFSPTLAEMEAVKTELRTKTYNEALTELNNLNKIYPNKNFVLHDINFLTSVYPAANRYMNTNMMVMEQAAPAAAPVLTVSDKVQVQAVVVLAAQFKKND